MNYRTYRTLNEWESLTLDHLLTLFQEIIHSGFDNPINLRDRVNDLLEQLDSECEGYRFDHQLAYLDVPPELDDGQVLDSDHFDVEPLSF